MSEPLENNDKILTIAIPIFNGSKTVGRLLDSIYSQINNSMDVEVLISDNASTDNTATIVKKYSNISYYRNESNCGADENFCLSVKRAAGNHVWMIGDDDLIEPGAIEHVLKILKTNKNLGAIFVNYSSYDSVKKVFLLKKWLDIDEDIYCSNADEFLNITNVAPNFLSCIVHNKKSFLETNYSKYYGTFWIQFATLLDYLKTKDAYCIAKPYVVNAGISEDGGANVDGAFLGILCNLMKVITDLPNDSYSTASISKAQDKVRSFLTSKITSSRRRGLKINFDILNMCIKSFGGRLYFWIFQLPLLFMPKWFHNLLYKIYKIKFIHKIVWKNSKL
jgi:glycosyltransferase involved in cell wall biosynthesis